MENLLGGVNVLALQKEVSDMSRSVNDMRVELTGMRDNFAPIERQFSDVANRVGTVESSLSTVRLQVTNINAQMEKNTTSLQTVSADYEAFKSDILPRVSKNSSDIVNNTRQIQDLNLKMNAMYQDLEAQIQMPTIVSWVGVVAGAVGIGIGVYALLYAQEVAKMIDPE
jgi:capsule polysaccharide export protein KpsE/RkpR